MQISSLVRSATFLAATFATVSAPCAVKKKVPIATPSHKSKKAARAAGSRSRRKSVSAATSWRNRQSAPSVERYKEIQQALATKGYLKTEPSGVWDAPSQEAMKQFQSDQKLPPTGKINSPSLIGLGLGPKLPPQPPSSDATPPAAPTSPAAGESPLTQR